MSRPQFHAVALWAVPRSVSTAFEKTFACRADAAVAHEPFTDCYYFSRDRRSSRYGRQPDKEAFTAADAARLMVAGDRPVRFTKDLAFQAEPYLTDEMLAAVTNTFIVRHPRTVLRSLTPLKPDFTEDEFGFTALHRLFTRVRDAQPVVVDGDEFRVRPGEVLRDYCGRIGLEFDEAMLHWRDGRIRAWRPDEELSQSKWHHTLESSHTILPPTPEGEVEIPAERAGMYERAVEIYREISRFAYRSVTT
ncbi:hypothetical protein [Kutzneria sp. NPDC052558]|uniref:sulfotransferase-like domain-containing protein n=1 Tax=Kutzneria sp. NPDC052558 TaxID=3364121 RepID=UPI0037CAC41F